MIKAYIEQAIKNIELDKDKAIAPAKDRLVREKIAPHNAEVDRLRTKALLELDGEMNLELSEIRKKYEAKKQELIVLGETDKKAFAENVFANELAPLTAEYDSAIAKLTSQIAEINE